MATTVVFEYLDSGLTLSLQLRDKAGDIVNGEAPDAFVEVEDTGRYEATVSESLTGWYIARVLDSEGVLHLNQVKLAPDAVCLIGDAAAAEHVPPTVEEIRTEMESDGSILSGIPAYFDSLHNFDPATQSVTLAADQAVNVTKVNGEEVSGVDDFKADLTGLESALSVVTDKQEEHDGRFDDLDGDAESIIDDIAVVNADTESIKSSLATALNRIGAFTGTGVNTVLGAFKALFRKDVTVPSDIGGTFDPATESLEALKDGQPANYDKLAIDNDGKVMAVVDAEVTLPDGAAGEIAEQVIEAMGDGVNISDAGVARLAGTITKWVQPTWSGRGFDKSLVVGASYLGDLAPKLVLTDWAGESIADAASLTLVARRTSGTEVASLEFSLSPQDDVTVSGETTTVHITLTAEQTQSVAAGVYHADLIGEWSNGERHALVPDGFRISFREPARETPKAGSP